MQFLNKNISFKAIDISGSLYKKKLVVAIRKKITNFPIIFINMLTSSKFDSRILCGTYKRMLLILCLILLVMGAKIPTFLLK